jgi:hypothetical protein
MPAWQRLKDGLPPADVAPFPLTDPRSRFLQGRDTDRTAVNELKAAIRAGRECTVRLLNYTKAGKPFWNMLTVAPIKCGAARRRGCAACRRRRCVVRTRRRLRGSRGCASCPCARHALAFAAVPDPPPPRAMCLRLQGH